MTVRRPKRFYQIVQDDGTGSGATDFLSLTDTPASYSSQGGKAVQVNSGGTALEFVTPAAATTFVGLTDTPSSYTGNGSKYVAVNSGATALEFITPPTAAKWSLIDSLSLSAQTDGQLSFSGITESSYAAFAIKGYVTASSLSAVKMYCVEGGAAKKGNSDYLNENSNNASSLQELVQSNNDLKLAIFDAVIYGIASGVTTMAMVEGYLMQDINPTGYEAKSALSQRGVRQGTAACEAIEIGTANNNQNITGWFGLYGLSK